MSRNTQQFGRSSKARTMEASRMDPQRQTAHMGEVPRSSQELGRVTAQKGTRLSAKKKTDLALEEEYINNLQKQIYFLEIELKLLKDKEKEHKAMFPLQGMETGPLNESITALKTKYHSLQGELETRIAQTASEHGKHSMKHLSLQIAIERASSEHKASSDFYNSSNALYHDTLETLRKQLHSETTQKEEAAKRIAELTKERDLAKAWADELKLKFEKQEFTLKKQQEKMGQMEGYKHYVVDYKNKQIVELQGQITTLQDRIHNDASISNLEERIREITEAITQATLDREKILVKVRSLEFAKEMIERNSTQISEDKATMHKQSIEIQAEIDRERLAMDSMLNKRIREQDNKELKSLMKAIEDARKEAHYHMEQYKTKDNEHSILSESIRELTQEYRTLGEKIHEMAALYQKHREQYEMLEREEEHTLSVLRGLQSSQRSMVAEKEKLQKEANELFNENAELRAQVIVLTKKLESDDNVRKFDLEDLKMYSRSNVQINESIHQLLGKWDGIQSFNKNY